MSNLLPDSIGPKRRARFVGLVAALVVSGCASAAGTTSTTARTAIAQTAPAVTSAAAVSRPRQGSHPPQRSRPGASPSRPGSLAYSTTSNDRVQPQPPPGSCHAIGTGLYSRPDPRCTPGALNPAVTQATVDRTICVEGWTATVRPPENVTEQEKAASMAAYGDTGSMGAYEYDHFEPLELGGATNDPRNLWPEPGASPNPKDAVEDELRREVCDRQVSLATAQREIATNWISLARGSFPSSPGRPPSGTPRPHGAECTLTASYNSRYHDYDVYIHSDQPDQTATVTDSYGHSGTWRTDGSGYADVYFKSGGYAPGRRITARVGPATCSTHL